MFRGKLSGFLSFLGIAALFGYLSYLVLAPLASRVPALAHHFAPDAA